MTPLPINQHELNRAFDRWRATYAAWKRNPTDEKLNREKSAAWDDLERLNEDYLAGVKREVGT